MHVVSCNYFGADFLRKPYKVRQYLPFLWYAVVLNFYVKILAENPLQFKRHFLRALVIARKNTAGNAACKASGKTNNALGMLLQHLVVNLRLIIKAVDKRH